MHRIDTANARPNVNGTGKTGFHDNTDLAGQDATYLDPDWCNALQEEVATVIEAHEPLDKAKHGQLKASLLAIFATNTALDEVDHRLSAAMTALASAMQQAIIDERNAERNRVWPVGTGRYTTYDGLNPAHASHLGWGTWVADTLSAGRVLVGAGEIIIDYSSAIDDAARPNAIKTFVVGEVGGELDHKQTMAEGFSHNHTTDPRFNKLLPTFGDVFDDTEYSAQTTEAFNRQGQVNEVALGTYDNAGAEVFMQRATIKEVGGGQPANVMQPYLVVSVWRRTG